MAKKRKISDVEDNNESPVKEEQTKKLRKVLNRKRILAAKKKMILKKVCLSSDK